MRRTTRGGFRQGPQAANAARLAQASRHCAALFRLDTRQARRRSPARRETLAARRPPGRSARISSSPHPCCRPGARLNDREGSCANGFIRPNRQLSAMRRVRRMVAAIAVSSVLLSALQADRPGRMGHGGVSRARGCSAGRAAGQRGPAARAVRRRLALTRPHGASRAAALRTPFAEGGPANRGGRHPGRAETRATDWRTTPPATHPDAAPRHARRGRSRRRDPGV